MIAFLFLFIFAICLLYKHYSTVNSKWARRGIRGPVPELLFGNLREIWAAEKPKALVLRDWSKQFGKVYGYYEGQRPYIVVSDVETINQILVHKSDHFHARTRQLSQRRVDGGNTVIAKMHGANWKRFRAVGSMAFTPKSLTNVLPTIEASLAVLLGRMEKEEGEIDALTFFREYNICVTFNILLGIHDVEMFNNPYLDTLRSLLHKPLRHAVYAVAALFPFIVDTVGTALHILAKLRIMKTPFEILMEKLRTNVRERKIMRMNNNSAHDFIDIFLDAEVEAEGLLGQESETAKKLSTEEVVGVCFILLIAGYNTTSSSLAFITHLLANHDKVQKRLIEEIDAFLDENETIDIASLNRLPYLDAVIKESLRLYPQSSALTTRECAKACEIDGIQFEVGDMVAIDAWTAHMDENVWGEDAKEFRPERWLQASSHPRSAFFSFGGGPRICVGMRLASMEAKLAFVRLLGRFSIEKTENTNPIKLVGSSSVNPEQVMVKLVRRIKT